MPYLITRLDGMPPNYALRDGREGRLKQIERRGTVFHEINSKVLALILDGKDPHITPIADVGKLPLGAKPSGTIAPMSEKDAEAHIAAAPPVRLERNPLTIEDFVDKHQGRCPGCDRQVVPDGKMRAIDRGELQVASLSPHPVVGRHSEEDCCATVVQYGELRDRAGFVSLEALQALAKDAEALRSEITSLRPRFDAAIAANRNVGNLSRSRNFLQAPADLAEALSDIAVALAAKAEERRTAFDRASARFTEAREAVATVKEWLPRAEAAETASARRRAAIAGFGTREKENKPSEKKPARKSVIGDA